MGVSHAQDFVIVFPGLLFACLFENGCWVFELRSSWLHNKRSYPLSHLPGPSTASKCSTLALPMGSL